MIIIQSYIDLITNSSTSVFQYANNIEGVKDIINAVLEASGSNLTCDDLFNIESHYNIGIDEAEDFYYNLACEKIENDRKLKDLVNEYNTGYREDIKILKRIYEYLVKNYNVKTLDEYAAEYNINSDEFKYSLLYRIKAKDPKNEKYSNIINSLNYLFDYDVMYC